MAAVSSPHETRAEWHIRLLSNVHRATQKSPGHEVRPCPVGSNLYAFTSRISDDI